MGNTLRCAPMQAPTRCLPRTGPLSAAPECRLTLQDQLIPESRARIFPGERTSISGRAAGHAAAVGPALVGTAGDVGTPLAVGTVAAESRATNQGVS
jgi:hypothetical protein